VVSFLNGGFSTWLVEQSSSPATPNRRKGHLSRLSARVIGCFQPPSTLPGYEVLPRDRAVRQHFGILSVFDFIFSSPGLDGAGDQVMEYRWL